MRICVLRRIARLGHGMFGADAMTMMDTARDALNGVGTALLESLGLTRGAKENYVPRILTSPSDALGIIRSTLDARRSTLDARRSTLDARQNVTSELCALGNPAWLRRWHRSPSPSEFSSTNQRSASRRRGSSSASFALSASCLAAGAGCAVRRLRRGVAAALLGLPLLTGLPSGAAAQAAELPTFDLVGEPRQFEGQRGRFLIFPGDGAQFDKTIRITLEISQVGDGNVIAPGQTGRRTVEFRPGQQRVILHVNTVDDKAHDGDTRLRAVMIPGSDYGVSKYGYHEAEIAVIDDDIPVISVEAGPNINEGGTARFNLRASPTPIVPLTVNVDVAASGGDFAPSGATGRKTVSIGTNGRGTLDVATESDAIDEDDGIIMATLQTGDTYQVGAKSSARVAISDGGTPTPSVSISGPGAIAEGETITFTLRASPAPVTPIDVSVTLTESGSFAASGQISARTVNIGTSGTATFTVATENDRTAEADGAITASLAKASGYLVGSPATARVTVRDTTPAVNISAGPAIVEGGEASFTLTVTPRLTSSLDVNVRVSDSGDFADNFDTGDQIFTIPASGTFTFTVRTNDDGTLETDGTITATVRSGTGYGPGTAATASVRVTDSTPRVSIAGGSAVVEGDDAVFTLTAAPPPTSSLTVFVEVSDSGSFANLGETGRRIVDIDTNGTGTLRVTTEDDEVDEAQEQGTITARIAAGSAPAYYGIRAPDTATVRVNDNDAAPQPWPAVSISDAEIQEDANHRRDDYLEFTVTLDRASATTTSVNFEVRATTETDTTAPATLGVDYKAPQSQLVRFPIGATERTIRIEVLDDDEYEEKPETFEVVITTVERGEIADGKATGTILPDPADAPRDMPVVSIEGPLGALTEGDRAIFTVKAEPAPRQDIEVTLTVRDDGASDFLEVADEGTRTIIIPGLDQYAFAAFKGVSKREIRIQTVDDLDREADGNIAVTVEADPDRDADGVYEVDTQSYEAVVQVEDNERAKPVISIAGGPKVTEGGAATFTLTADPAPQKDLVVTVSVQDDGGDFIADENEVSRTVTIDAVSDGVFSRRRQATASFTVETVDDAIFESDANIRAVIELDSGDDYDVSQDTYEAVVEIEDNERGTPLVTIEAGPAVTEGEAASFTLNAVPAPEQDLDVLVTVSSAAGGLFLADSNVGDRTITIPGVSEADFAQRRDTSMSFTVNTVDDAQIEDSGGVQVYINSADSYDTNEDYEATVPVQDDDTPTISVSAPTGQILEGQPLVFTLNIDPVSSSELFVNVDVKAPNNDYVDTSGTQGTGQQANHPRQRRHGDRAGGHSGRRRRGRQRRHRDGDRARRHRLPARHRPGQRGHRDRHRQRRHPDGLDPRCRGPGGEIVMVPGDAFQACGRVCGGASFNAKHLGDKL